MCRLVAERRALVNRQLDRARRALDGLVGQLAEAAPADDPDASTEAEAESSKQPPDAPSCSRCPVIGTKVLAALAAEGRDAAQRRDDEALRCLCGVASVTRRSGKSLVVTRRLAAHERLRDAACHWARVAAQRDPVSQDKHQALRAPRPRTRPHPAFGGRPPAQSTSPARCCATPPASTRTVSGLPLREPDQRPVALGVWMALGRRSRPEGASGPVRVLRDSGAARRRRPCRQ